MCTWCTDVAAASIKLLAGTVTLLLLPAGQNVDVHWPRGKVLDHDPHIRSIVLVGTIDAACVPVSPIDELAKHGHSKGVYGCADDDFSIGPREGRSLDLLPGCKAKQLNSGQ